MTENREISKEIERTRDFIWKAGEGAWSEVDYYLMKVGELMEEMSRTVSPESRHQAPEEDNHVPGE